MSLFRFGVIGGSQVRAAARFLSVVPRMPVPTGALVASLRGEMRKRSLQAYIVPSEDAHFSEYLAPCDKRRAFISGFSGSAGFAIVTAGEAAGEREHATVWTDGRYWLQAASTPFHVNLPARNL